MIWSYFIIFALVSVVLWATGAWAAWCNRRALAFATTGFGLAIFFAYILIMWITLERPPLRTMGETRLWYSFFLPLAGVIVYSRCQHSLQPSLYASISSNQRFIPRPLCLLCRVHGLLLTS